MTQLLRIGRLFIPTLLWLGSTFLFFHSCANYRPHYHTSVRQWARQPAPPEDSIVHRLFLLGDLGSDPTADSFPVIDMLERHLEAAPSASSLLLLGDLIAGREENPTKTGQSRGLQKMLDAARSFSGQILVVHGERDWSYGIAGLDSLHRFIRTQLPEHRIAFTRPGCGDLKEVEVTPNLSILLLDSPWWLTDWKGKYRINSGCEVKSRQGLSIRLEETLKNSRGKNILLAMHHPLQSSGAYGGAFPLKTHLFPLTELNKNLWIPLPFAGSLYPLYRSTIGGPQDLAYYRYRDLYQMLIPLARENGPFLFAAAHEHGLQYFEAEEQHFIGSGSAVRQDPLHRDRGTRFGYGHRGFAELLFLKGGAVWLAFRVPDDKNPSGRVVFREKIKAPLPYLKREAEPTYPLYESGTRLFRQPISAYDFSHSRLGNWLWGKNYRTLYQEPMSFPMLDLYRFRGGVTPLQRGGGYTTNTLKLRAQNGREYIMRSVEKDPSRTLPYPFNKSFALSVLQDQFSGIHPFGALPIPGLCEAAGILHTNPRLYFVPRQPGLAPHNTSLGNGVYLVEERPDGNWGDAPFFANAPNIVGTETLYDRLTSGEPALLDQKALARARLFDLLIGDWDRDADQWRWAELPTDSQTWYRPIPRDRDQAFSRFEGIYMGLVRFLVGPAKQFGTYGPTIPNHIRWSCYSALDFDRTFLTELEWPEMKAEALHLQQSLTDSVIDRAFAEAWRPYVQEQSPDVVNNLKSRRDNSLKIAQRFYEHISRLVDVKGSLQKDGFEIERLPDGRTQVRVWQLTDAGQKARLQYERTFRADETREIRLFGLDGADRFELKGYSRRKGSTLRLIGGLGPDTLRDASRNRGWKKSNRYYDFEGEAMSFSPSRETRLIRSDDPSLLSYNPLGHDYAYHRLTLLPDGGFNPDDGVFLGFSADLKTYGFKKEPFATRQILEMRYAFRTNGFLGRYRATLVDVLGKWEFFFDFYFSNPLYANNFYGFGNDTPNFEEERGLDYNRVRMRKILLFPALMNQRNTSSLIAFGPWLEAIQVSSTGDRFIDEVAEELGPNTFGNKTFLGPRLFIQYDNFDSEVFRTRGMSVFLDAGWRFQLERPQRNYPYLNLHLSFYFPLDAARSLIFGTRIGGMHLFAQPDEFEFYHAATLGGLGPNVNIRGFRRDRFSGRTAFFHNLGLEYELFQWENRLLPLAGGLTLGLDYGRVWMPGTPAGNWHFGYGGGFFLNPIDLISFRAGLFRGNRETTTFTAILGFFF